MWKSHKQKETQIKKKTRSNAQDSIHLPGKVDTNTNPRRLRRSVSRKSERRSSRGGNALFFSIDTATFDLMRFLIRQPTVSDDGPPRAGRLILFPPPLALHKPAFPSCRLIAPPSLLQGTLTAAPPQKKNTVSATASDNVEQTPLIERIWGAGLVAASIQRWVFHSH